MTTNTEFTNVGAEEIIKPNTGDKIAEISRPRCGSCMWLKNPYPGDPPCADIVAEDADGVSIRITETSEICEYYTPKNPALENLHSMLRACSMENLKVAKTIVPLMVRHKSKEEMIPLDKGDTVAFTVIEKDGSIRNITNAIVFEVGKVTFKALVHNPKDPSEPEFIVAPREIDTLQVIRKTEVEEDEEGSNRVRKGDATVENVTKARIRNSKREMKVLAAVKKSADEDGRADLSEVVEQLSYEEEEVERHINVLRTYKMVAKQEGQFKITQFGRHSLKRLGKTKIPLVTWEKLGQIHGPKSKTKTQETSSTATKKSSSSEKKSSSEHTKSKAKTKKSSSEEDSSSE